MIKFPSSRPALIVALVFLGVGFLIADLATGLLASLLILVIYYLICINVALEQLYKRLDTRLYDLLTYLNPITQAVERREKDLAVIAQSVTSPNPEREDT